MKKIQPQEIIDEIGRATNQTIVQNGRNPAGYYQSIAAGMEERKTKAEAQVGGNRVPQTMAEKLKGGLL